MQFQRSLVLVCLAITAACGIPSNPAPLQPDIDLSPKKELIKKQLDKLSRSFIERDVSSLRPIFSDVVLNRLKAEHSGDLDRGLARIVAEQRDGWIATLGGEEFLRERGVTVASLVEMPAGTFEVAVEVKGESDPKTLFFREEGGELKFHGPRLGAAEVSGTDAVAVAKQEIAVWKFRYHNYYNAPLAASQHSYSCPSGAYGTSCSGGDENWRLHHVHPYNENTKYDTYCDPMSGGTTCWAQLKLSDAAEGWGWHWCYAIDLREACVWQWIGEDVWWTSTGAEQCHQVECGNN